MKILQVALITLTLTTVAFARLGETEAELIARFGQPKNRSKDMMGAQGRMWDVGPKYHFQQADWHIYCVLVDGRCVWIDYGKPKI